jgi:hypothetical protein
MSPTFDQLNIPFQLFKGPLDQAAEYCGVDDCSLCGDRQQHCFQLGIGCGLILPCPSCGTENGLDADDREDGSCRHCQTTVSFPAELLEDEIKVCYACLRSGKAAITKNTELGMISWEQAFFGFSGKSFRTPYLAFGKTNCTISPGCMSSAARRVSGSRQIGTLHKVISVLESTRFWPPSFRRRGWGR